jgi:alkyldihydroxyacetonephosphate synthase
VSREQVFWGWGEPGAGPQLPERAVRFLSSELGVSGEVVAPPVSLEEVRLGKARLPDGLRDRLAAICEVRGDREARVLRCRGKSYLDLLAQRAGDCEDAPDAVVRPRDPAQVQAVIRACAEAGVAVVPFGGGTSVVGGLEPIRGPFESLVSLDLAGMDRLISVDERSRTATFQPGARLPEADAALAAHGFTLGHFPQSYEWATVGGCVVTRSSTRTSSRCVAPRRSGSSPRWRCRRRLPGRRSSTS